MRTSKSLMTLLALTSGALLAAAGCGDDDGNNPDARVTFDARVIDGGDDDPDAGVPDAGVQTRSATLAVQDVRVTTPGAAARAVGGAAVSLRFENILEGGVAPVYDSNPTSSSAVGKCVVSHFTVGTDVPHPEVDEGAITIGGEGILKPSGEDATADDKLTCVYTNGVYRCPTGNQTAQSGTAIPRAGGAVDYTFVGQTFDANHVGQHIRIVGIDAPNTNPPVYDGVFPIFQVVVLDPETGVTSIRVANSQSVGQTPNVAVPFANAGYTTFAGVGPIPGGVASANFLNDDPTKKVKISLAAGASESFPNGFTVELEPIGAAITLDDDSAKPEAFPTTDDAEVTFVCTGATCGSAPSPSTASGLIVTGLTTDAPLPSAELDPLGVAMPPAVTKFSTFTCTSELFQSTVTFPVEALTAILATNPTRIETRVLRVSFNPISDGLNTGNAVVGHGLVGHTNVPAPE